MVTPLTIYKASAGSGKTFTLATEYIRLLVENPTGYRGILAVTFTNKATEEMKMRILSQLYGIWKQLPESDGYLKAVQEKTGLPPQTISERAGIGLSNLLNNYNYFRVETIDTFFQSIMRNMARELDLTTNLRIGLNDYQVEELAVDQLIADLDTTDAMLQWILNYIMESISDDKSWNIIGQVKNFGRTIFRDEYKNVSERLDQKLAEPGFFDRYTTRLRELRQAAIEQMKSIADRFFDILDDEGLTVEDFSYGKTGICGFFLKLRQGIFDESILGKRVTDSVGEPQKWYKKSHPRRELLHALADGPLDSLLRQAIDEQPRQWRIYKSADLTLRHLNQLRLLGSIEQKVHELNADANRFLLSDTQQLLHALIGDSDSPFIFEKIGAQLEHVMIDEFQDTSTVQWQNFRVLLHEAMSHEGSRNLIVGDVKQSIYRWRDGDWRLLNGIMDEFGNNDSLVQIKPLDTNYRSSRKVIEFNNAFFILAAQKEESRLQNLMGEEARQLGTAYSDVVQKVKEDRPDTGYVRIEMMEKEAYNNNIMAHIADTIRQLTSNGIPQREIAILSRSNSEIEKTAQYFQMNMPDVNIVSDEAFKLGSSLSVGIIINAMRLLANEKDILCAATLAKTYQDAILGNDDTDFLLLTPTSKDPKQLPYSHLLPEGFRNSHDTDHLRGLPLTDMTEAIYTTFGLDRLTGQSAYICTFYDKLADFLKDNPSDIDRFLEAWDENLYKEKIHGDQLDGVRMVTIHKSKGLEYDNVIIPFSSWEMEKSGYVIWCETNVEPFNMLQLLPINYSKTKMVGTVYEEDFNHEHLQNSVDNLNLLYVAFTRAKKRLFVMGKAKDNPQRSNGARGKGTSTKDDSKTIPTLRSELICDCLPELPKNDNLKGCTLEISEDGSMVFEYGRCFEEEDAEEQEEPTKNIFLLPERSESFAIKSHPTRAQFRQSNNSREFTADDEERLIRYDYITQGNLLHAIFSRLRNLDDIERVLLQLTHEGILYDEVPESELRQLLQKALSNKKARGWFSPHWHLHNECAILYKDSDTGQTKECRPDRVMSDDKKTIVVDYKFGKPNTEHEKQVKKYMKHLTAMGHARVEGYLWYVWRNKVVEVKQ